MTVSIYIFLTTSGFQLYIALWCLCDMESIFLNSKYYYYYQCTARRNFAQKYELSRICVPTPSPQIPQLTHELRKASYGQTAGAGDKLQQSRSLLVVHLADGAPEPLNLFALPRVVTVDGAAEPVLHVKLLHPTQHQLKRGGRKKNRLKFLCPGECFRVSFVGKQTTHKKGSSHARRYANK